MDSDLTSLCTRKKRKKAQNTLFWRKVRARDAKLGAGVVCVEDECLVELGAGVVCVEDECLVELGAASWLSRNWQNEKTDSHICHRCYGRAAFYLQAGLSDTSMPACLFWR